MMLAAGIVGAALLLAVSLIDLRTHRIPNRLTYPALFACASLALVGTWQGTGWSVVPAIVGSALFGGLLFVPNAVSPAAMGFGDVKLALILGFAIGWVRNDIASAVLAVGCTLAFASLLGLIGAALAQRRQGWRPERGQAVAFGPSLSAAGAIAIAWPLT